MISYFDTSAVVPLLVGEPASAFCRELWDSADSVVTSRLCYVEAAAAPAQARRLKRINAGQHLAALKLLKELWPEFELVEADAAVVQRAAQLAHTEALRGYDAVHCACAEQLQADDLVVASGDRALLAACSRLGLATAATAAETFA